MPPRQEQGLALQHGKNILWQENQGRLKVAQNRSLGEGKKQTQIIPLDQVLRGQQVGCVQKQMEKGILGRRGRRAVSFERSAGKVSQFHSCSLSTSRVPGSVPELDTTQNPTLKLSGLEGRQMGDMSLRVIWRHAQDTGRDPKSIEPKLDHQTLNRAQKQRERTGDAAAQRTDAAASENPVGAFCRGALGEP